jgi:hypothetical protein
MNEDERNTMITIGKAVTELAATVKKMQESMAPTAPVPSTLVPQPPRVSVVDHEGPASCFKMEIGFEQGKQWSQEQRQDHCIKLLTEVEELFREYGVEKLVGNYTRHGVV